MSEGCPICGESEPHEHIISDPLPPGTHPTYEELVIAKRPDFAAWCAEEREGGAGGCGACVLCCKELQEQRDEAWLALGAILECASSGGPQDMMVDLGMIRIECRRALGQPGATDVPTLREMINRDE